MDDMLSKEEIDALLGVVDGKTFKSKDEGEEDDKEKVIDTTNLAEDETDGIINNIQENENENLYSKENEIYDSETLDEDHATSTLTDREVDILGEVGNISMGTSATTLYTILNEKVSITTPQVEIIRWRNIADSFEKPCVGIRVNYKEGLRGSNALLLKDQDVKTIASIMMNKPNGREISIVDEPLTDLDLSAIVEAMNQMVGSSATSLSSMLNMTIDIETPIANIIEFEEDGFDDNLGFHKDEEVVKISFRMIVGDILDSTIMQIIPMDFAKEMVSILYKETSTIGDRNMEKTSISNENFVIDETSDETSDENYKEDEYLEEMNDKKIEKTISDKDLFDEVQKHKTLLQPSRNVNVSNAQFQNFTTPIIQGHKENISIIMDVPLEVTVELGRTNKKIKEILEFSPGTIIELDKIAGDPIDILVNGKYVAKGEVVVIDENFGIRITDIVGVESRI